MKATIEIEDDLYRRLKAAAALAGCKIKDLVAEGIVLVLQERTTSLREDVDLPLIDCGPPGSLDIADDVAHSLDLGEDLLRHEASLRQ